MSVNDQTSAIELSFDLAQLRWTGGSWRRHSAGQFTCWCDADNKSDLNLSGRWL